MCERHEGVIGVMWGRNGEFTTLRHDDDPADSAQSTYWATYDRIALAFACISWRATGDETLWHNLARRIERSWLGIQRQWKTKEGKVRREKGWRGKERV